jgi:3,4-dihydroxy 2-butanone 4-phosphate synthase
MSIAIDTGHVPPQSTSFVHLMTAVSRGETAVILHDRRASLVYSARTASTTQTTFAIRHTSGFLQIALPSTACERLMIPTSPLSSRPSAEAWYQQCIGVDSANGVTTGISAADRAQTARMLASPSTVPEQLHRPGHLIVVAVDPYYRGTHALPMLCNSLAAAHGTVGVVFADLVSRHHPVDMADTNEALEFADLHGLLAYPC